VLGAHFRQDTIPSEVEYNVVTITVHPDYDSSVHSSDIALLELETPVLVNENIRPVCAPDPDDVYEGTTAEISGWGTLSSGRANHASGFLKCRAQFLEEPVLFDIEEYSNVFYYRRIIAKSALLHNGSDNNKRLLSVGVQRGDHIR